MIQSQHISASVVEAFSDEMSKIAEETEKRRKSTFSQAFTGPIKELANNPWGNLALGVGTIGIGTGVGIGLGMAASKLLPTTGLGRRFSKIEALERAKILTKATGIAGGLTALSIYYKHMARDIYNKAATDAHLEKKVEDARKRQKTG